MTANAIYALNKSLKKTNSLFVKLAKNIFENSHTPKVLLQSMEYSVLSGGKRLRPFIVSEVGKLFNVKLEDSINAALAIEIVHCFSLVYDDLPSMDDDKLRRGQPTTHVEYGESTAILSGASLLILAFRHLSNKVTHSSLKIRNELIKGLADSIGSEGMMAGQFLDLEAEKNNMNLLEKNYIEIQEKKTGALMSYSAKAGAILGKASKKEKSILSDYGFLLGRIYQITDDLLDIEGNKKDLGKEVKKDQKKNKATLIQLKGIEAAKSEAYFLSLQAKSKLKELKVENNNLEYLVDFILNRKK